MEQQMGNEMKEGKMCKCPHHKIMPWAIIIVGIAFIAAPLNLIMPGTLFMVVGVLLILKGVMKLNGRKCKCCSSCK